MTAARSAQGAPPKNDRARVVAGRVGYKNRRTNYRRRPSRPQDLTPQDLTPQGLTPQALTPTRDDFHEGAAYAYGLLRRVGDGKSGAHDLASVIHFMGGDELLRGFSSVLFDALRDALQTLEPRQ